MRDEKRITEGWTPRLRPDRELDLPTIDVFPDVTAIDDTWLHLRGEPQSVTLPRHVNPREAREATNSVEDVAGFVSRWGRFADPQNRDLSEHLPPDFDAPPSWRHHDDPNEWLMAPRRERLGSGIGTWSGRGSGLDERQSMEQLVSVDEVLLRIRVLWQLGAHLLAFKAGDVELTSLWADLEVPPWPIFADSMNAALSLLTTTVDISGIAGLENYEPDLPPVTGFVVGAGQIANDLDLDPDMFRNCANESCRQPFTRQRDRAASGQRRVARVEILLEVLRQRACAAAMAETTDGGEGIGTMTRRRGNGEGTITRRADGQGRGGTQLHRSGRRAPALSKLCTHLEGREGQARRSQAASRRRSAGEGLECHGRRLRDRVDRQRTRGLAAEGVDEAVLRDHRSHAPRAGPIRRDHAGAAPPVRRRAVAHDPEGDGTVCVRACRTIYSVLRAALDIAVRDGLVRANVAAAVKRPSEERHDAAYLNRDQVNALLTAARTTRLRALYVLMLGTGLRRGEALALRWSDIDFARGVLRVRGTLNRVNGLLVVSEPKTKQSRRSVSRSRLRWSQSFAPTACGRPRSVSLPDRSGWTPAWSSPPR